MSGAQGTSPANAASADAATASQQGPTSAKNSKLSNRQSAKNRKAAKKRAAKNNPKQDKGPNPEMVIKTEENIQEYQRKDLEDIEPTTDTVVEVKPEAKPENDDDKPMVVSESEKNTTTENPIEETSTDVIISSQTDNPDLVQATKPNNEPSDNPNDAQVLKESKNRKKRKRKSQKKAMLAGDPGASTGISGPNDTPVSGPSGNEPVICKDSKTPIVPEPGANEATLSNEPNVSVSEPGANEAGAKDTGADELGADELGADELGADEPRADAPGADAPGADVSGVNEPGESEFVENEPDVYETGENEPGAPEPPMISESGLSTPERKLQDIALESGERAFDEFGAYVDLPVDRDHSPIADMFSQFEDSSSDEESRDDTGYDDPVTSLEDWINTFKNFNSN